MRVRIWSAVVCLAALSVGHAPVSAHTSTAPAATAPTDLATLRARVHQVLAERQAGAAPGAVHNRFEVAPLTRDADADAPRALALAPPEQVTAGPAISRAYLQWQPPIGGDSVTGYRVYRGTSMTNLTSIGTTTGTAILDRGLALATTYYYAVAAISPAGEGERSAPEAVVVPRAELIFSLLTTGGWALVAQAHPGAPLVPVIDDGHNNVHPAVSPDGRWLAYTSDIGGWPGVYVRPADGTGTPKQIFGEPPPDSHADEPSWSADGKTLVITRRQQFWSMSYAVPVHTPGERMNFRTFGSGSWTAGASVVGVDTDTGALVEESFAVRGRRTVKSDAHAVDADVSPDGEWIAFTHIDGEEFGFPVTSIRLVPRRGGSTTILTAPGGVNTGIAWSRRGSQLFFTHEGIDDDGLPEPVTIFTVNRDGSGLRSIGPADGPNAYPAHREVLAPQRATAPKPPTVIPDFDGDGEHDLGVFRPSTGTWHVRGKFTVKYGRADDVPVPADFNGDKKSEVAVWRPSTGMWHIRGMRDVKWGRRGDVPVPADYNGDGRDEIAVWRPSTGMWLIRGVRDVKWGRKGDIPFVGRWHSSVMEPAVWRPSTGTWYINRTGGWPNKKIKFGRPGDVPVRSAVMPREQIHDLGIFRPSTATYYQYEPRHNRRTLFSTKTFTRPVQAYAAVPLGWVWRGEGGEFGHDGLFQPATGSWGTDMFIYGRRGDLPL